MLLSACDADVYRTSTTATASATSTPARTPTALRATPVAEVYVPTPQPQCVDRGTPGPAVRSTGVPIIDAVIDAAIDGDRPRLAALVVGHDRPCEYEGIPPGPGVACPPGALKGTPTRVYFSASCSIDENWIGSMSVESTRFFLADTTDFVGVFESRSRARRGQLGEYLVAFRSPVHGLKLAAIEGSGMVGFVYPRCFGEVQTNGAPLSIDRLVAAWSPDLELIFVP